MRKESQPQNEMLKGTLDMMILRSLVGGDAHGHTIAKVMITPPMRMTTNSETTSLRGLKSLNSF